ncbi:MAG: hypothetical protein RR012_08570 [Oscillospiraceae bacterium]
MKFDKSKAIIAVMAVALVGTTTVALANVVRIQNESKGASEKMANASKIVAESAIEEITDDEVSIISKNMTKPVAGKSATQQTTPPTVQQTQPTTESNKVLKTIQLNQSICDTNGNTITFTEVKITEQFILVSFKIKMGQYSYYHLSGYDMKYINDRGQEMVKPDGYRVKYQCNEYSYAMFAPDPDIKSITVTYTFDDGTVDSTTLNLA